MALHWHSMTDIETLGMPIGSIVFAVGIVFFDENSIGEEHLIKISVKDLERYGFTSDTETKSWWKDDPTRRTLAVELCKDALPLFDAAKQISALLHQSKTMWAWGISFDLAHVRNLLNFINFQWPHRAERDARTLCALAGTNQGRVKPHHPVEDCKEQIVCVQRALKELALPLR